MVSIFGTLALLLSDNYLMRAYHYYVLQALLLLSSSWRQIDAAGARSSVLSGGAATHSPKKLRANLFRKNGFQNQFRTEGEGGVPTVQVLVGKEVGEQTIKEPIPLLLKPWVHLSRSLPLSFTIASALFLTVFDYSSGFFFQKASGWPSNECRTIAGSLTTIFHSTVLVTGLGVCLLTAEHYKPSGRMTEHPLWWRDAATALIQFCTGYMLYDSCIQFIADRWVPGMGPILSATDYMFLAHHAATSFYMISARMIRAGHMSAMALMFLGEITAPIMNVVRISQAAARVGISSTAWLSSAQPALEYTYALLYIILRVLVGPACAVHLTYDLLRKEGRKNVPLQLSLPWLAMCWGVMLGSIPWIENAFAILSRAGSSIA